LGAGIFQIMNIENLENISVLPLMMGFGSAAMMGYLVIDWLLKIIIKGKLYYFSLYCFIIAIIAYFMIY